MLSEPDEGRAHVARWLVAMEKHTAFLAGAIGIEMTLMFKEDDLIFSAMTGMETTIAWRLVVPARPSASGWMDDARHFRTLEELVTF